jgi:hypothetical protein
MWAWGRIRRPHAASPPAIAAGDRRAAVSAFDNVSRPRDSGATTTWRPDEHCRYGRRIDGFNPVGSLLANVEIQITPGFAANGEFGNGSMGFPDWSVAYNNNEIC